MRRNLFLFFQCYFLLWGIGAASAFSQPDTGQTRCYQSVSPYAEIPCAGTGQDGAYSINPVSFTDNSDGTVTDNNTGLVWQKEDDGTARKWGQAISYCDSLSLSGTGWRLPSRKELISIADYGITYPGQKITPVFTNAKQSYYWSSTPRAYFPSRAWCVDFNGSVHSHYNSNYNYVRCVRGVKSEALASSAPAAPFTDNGNGTVTYNKTGLVWQQGDPGAMAWPDALNYCENLELPSESGKRDWRLPNIKELESLTDDLRYNPAIDNNYFKNAVASSYWSSTTNFNNPSNAWNVYFGNGYVDNDYKAGGYNVRCVRGGQPRSFGNFVLLISKSGMGAGVVTVNIGTITWSGSAGTASYNSDTVVMLTATAAPGSTFLGWSGEGCSGTGICTVTMNASKSVTAAFAAQQ